MKFKNIFKHFYLITKHRWIVFKLCCKVGEPFRGVLHDLSKYSPTEFLEGVKYYVGTHSPITEAKNKNGYSLAWLHHKGRNKHHAEYWVDENAPDKTPVIPYKYAVEMVCDKLAAGMVYMGKNFTKEYELEYWIKEKEKTKINEKTAKFITEVLTRSSKRWNKSNIDKKEIKRILYKIL